jgi:hypothetical protein
MTEKEIKAWSLSIAASLSFKDPNESDKPIKELMEWLKEAAKPIAAEIRNTPDS